MASANISEIKNSLRELYLADQRPWVVGYSGGKLLPVLYKRGQLQNTFEQSFFTSEFKKAKSLAPFKFDDYPASGVGENKLYQVIFDLVSAQSS
jgi:hypothetical protein